LAGKKKATFFINKLKFYFIELTPQIALRRPILGGSTKRKGTLVDCIGYAAAIHYELKFLSYKQFEGIENVEFIK
jgi:hypothetical protein